MRFGRLASRLTSSDAALQSEDLRASAREYGGTLVEHLDDRQLAQCCGEVRCISLRPRSDGAPALVVDLDDGSRTLQLVWLGRRRIAGIEPGVFLQVHGRVSYRKGVPTIFNPAYEIKAR